jgi:hypothetical protein
MIYEYEAQQISLATRHGGAWGERRHSSSFLTSALDGVNGQRHAPAALCPEIGSPVSIIEKAGWASEPVWTKRLEEKTSMKSGGMILT